jgi:hypothetical protein
MITMRRLDFSPKRATDVNEKQKALVRKNVRLTDSSTPETVI